MAGDIRKKNDENISISAAATYVIVEVTK